MVTVAFVAPFLRPATARFVLAAARLPGARVGVVTCESVESLAPELREALSGHWRIDDALDPAQIAWGVEGLSQQLGRVDRLVAALEQLQVPLAHVRERLGIEGMDVQTALNVRDKAQMKSVLRAAGIPCARHALVSAPADAWAFAEQVGYPLVAKPPAGAGAQATYRLDDAASLTGWLAAQPPREGDPGLLEEWLSGQEHTLDSVTMAGQTVWSSICDYRPPPLDVLRNPWLQWTVLLPRSIDTPAYADILSVGPAALAALGVRDALTHMEWFRRPDGSVAVSEVAARPPGAQISSMLGWSYDMDFYAAWAALVVLDRFDCPPRVAASGTAYLRGQGKGRVRAVHGLAELHEAIGHLVVEAAIPSPGDPASSGYEGEGWITVRDPSTQVVEDALQRIISTVRVELEEAQ